MPESQKTKSENLVAKSPTTDLQPKNAETQKSRKINRKNKIGREDLFYDYFNRFLSVFSAVNFMVILKKNNSRKTSWFFLFWHSFDPKECPFHKNLVCFGDVPRGYDAFEQGDIGNGRARHPKQCEQMCSRMFKGCNAFSFDGHFCWFKKLESYTLRIVWRFILDF